MKKLVYLFLMISGVLISGCSDEPEPTFIELSAGLWKGTFEGPDNGIWELTIQNDGSVAGFIRSQNIPGFDFPGAGALSMNGDIQAIVDLTAAGSSEKAELNGKVVGTEVTGTWTNAAFGPNFGGTWQGTKVQ